MTPEAKAALRALAEKARAPADDWWGWNGLTVDCGMEAVDANFIIAASPQAVLALLGENARLREALGEVRRAVTNENNINGAAIMDTIWVSAIETAADCIDAALVDPDA